MSKRTTAFQDRASDRLERPAPPRRDRALERAIAADNIAILFQPQIEPGTGRVTGAEALARWDGEASAQTLFDRAARAGLTERLSRFAQRKALQLAGQWSGPLAGLRVSINLLAEDLARAD